MVLGQRRSGDSALVTALRQCNFGDGAWVTVQWPEVWCWCYHDSISMIALSIVLAPLASGVNNDGSLEARQNDN